MRPMKTTDPAIAVTDLQKTYRGGIEAVRGGSPFRSNAGGRSLAFGGAQRGGRQINDDHDVDDTDQPTGGSAIVNGLDIVKESYRVRTQLGVCLSGAGRG